MARGMCLNVTITKWQYGLRLISDPFACPLFCQLVRLFVSCCCFCAIGRHFSFTWYYPRWLLFIAINHFSSSSRWPCPILQPYYTVLPCRWITSRFQFGQLTFRSISSTKQRKCLVHIRVFLLNNPRAYDAAIFSHAHTQLSHHAFLRTSVNIHTSFKLFVGEFFLSSVDFSKI